jgi:hypothetical protein
MIHPEIEPGDYVEGFDFYGVPIAGRVEEVYGRQVFIAEGQEVFDPELEAIPGDELPTNLRSDRQAIATKQPNDRQQLLKPQPFTQS